VRCSSRLATAGRNGDGRRGLADREVLDNMKRVTDIAVTAPDNTQPVDNLGAVEAVRSGKGARLRRCNEIATATPSSDRIDVPPRLRISSDRVELLALAQRAPDRCREPEGPRASRGLVYPSLRL
jgi:hypothetical protein